MLNFVLKEHALPIDSMTSVHLVLCADLTTCLTPLFLSLQSTSDN